MENRGEINMADSLQKYCVWWIAIEVLINEAETFIPGTVTLFLVKYYWQPKLHMGM